MSCIGYHKDLEEPVPCPECGEWFELQDSRQSLKNALRLICPDCHDAEQRELKEEAVLSDDFDQQLHTLEVGIYCQHFVKRRDEGSGDCRNHARGVVRFIDDSGAPDELYVCKLHYRSLTDKLEKKDINFKSEIL